MLKTIASDNPAELVKLLSKIILQFGCYTQTSNKNLDIYFSALTQSLKKGSEIHELKPELLAISKTLTHLIQTKRQLGVNPSLIEYLTYRALTDNNEALLKIVQGFEQNEFASVDRLFSALDQVLFQTPSSAPADSRRQRNNQHSVINRLNLLLDDNSVPLKYKYQFALLKKRCHSKDIDEDTFNNIIESVINLFINIKKHTQLDQQTINDFLTNITRQIAVIEEQTQQASADNQISIDNRTVFSHDLAKQVNSILQSINQASELHILQENINNLLGKLNGNIQSHQLTECARQLSVQQQLLEVSQKLQDTEAETLFLRNQLQLAHNLAFQDTLTGLANRLAYDQRIDHELKRLQRHHQISSLIVWDIDFFKKINDVYGHKSGDKALISIAQLFIQNSRHDDFVARYGGEEFVMLLPNTQTEEAFKLADQIRILISNAHFNTKNEIIKITVSAGIHQLEAHDTVESAFEKADKALYQAKMNGRNQCWVSKKVTTSNHPE